VAPSEQPVLVTTAGRSPQQDRRDRERRYLITMGFRVVAFVVALLVTTGWIRVIAIVAALVLPWVAVILANSGPSRQPPEQPSLYSRRRPREITQRAESGEREP
jgi:Flp pilus assembly protein TadB